MERFTDAAQGYCEMYCKKYGHCFGDPGDCVFKDEVKMYEALKGYEFTGMSPADIRIMEISALREQEERRWIPVTERMPETIPCNAGTEYSEAVFVLTSGRKVIAAVWDGIDWLGAFGCWEAWGEKVTHWMPLPELPKGD